MIINKIKLTQQEKKWLTEPRITRLTDNKEVLIYPMGAERYLSLVLFGNKKGRYNIRADVEGKNILIIPGYGNSAFLFAHAGAKSITVYDKDPVTIAWIKAFKKYYHYRGADNDPSYPSIGELLTALTCWYPPLLSLPSGKFKNTICWAISPKSLRRTYIYYILSLIRHAIQSNSQDNFELNNNIKFYAGEITQLTRRKEKPVFDTAFVPYLLGVKNGIEEEKAIIDFIQQITSLVPVGHVLVNPAQDKKEFHFFGQRYFVTTGYSSIQSIPALGAYAIDEDKNWFKTQGMAIFGCPNQEVPQIVTTP